MSERTVYNRLHEPEFRRRIMETRPDLVRRSVGLLSAASGESMWTLLTLLE